MNLFLPEKQLEAWAIEEKVDVKDGHLVVEGVLQSFALMSAVHFVHLESGEDEKKLIGHVKTMAQLEALGAEQMRESTLIGETAYRVEPGYILALESLEPRRPSTSEADLLAAFILDKL